MQKWRDRAIIEISKDNFIPVWAHEGSTAWQSLSWEEKQKLQNLFNENSAKENELWKAQALNVLRPIVSETQMTPCAEDLGVNLSSLPEVLDELSILSLKVIRWCRDWGANGQPYVPLKDYPERSVATTSVHDSSTLRQWWNEEKSSGRAFIEEYKKEVSQDAPAAEDSVFGPKEASFVLQTSALCKSAWYVPPLQDYLYLDESYYKANPETERVNVPGSVNEFNWTYRIPVSVETLCKNKKLIKQINDIVKLHESEQQGGGE